jgi:tetratricopeptide (TPR) repeat protein
MPELPDHIHAAITSLSEDGDLLVEQGRYTEARALFESAWEQLPEPQLDWQAAFWLLIAIGDTHFLSGDFSAGRTSFMKAVKWFDEARGNPFACMRLGQCMFELGELSEASHWLAGAYLLEGVSIFENDDSKYLRFIKPQLRPPPGGWPNGW